MRRFPSLASLLLFTSCFALAACGGGGGSGSSGGGGTLPHPPPSTGFVPATGAITLIPSFPSNALGSTLLPGSTAANLVVQSATTPAEPKVGASLTEYATTETETGGLSTSAVMRSASAQSPHYAKHYSDPDTRFEVSRSRFSAIEKQIARLQRVPSRAIQSLQVRSNFVTGNTHDFYIQSGTITGGAGGGTNDCPGYSPCKKITAVLEAQSAHANVWVDQHSLADRNQFPSGAPDFTKLAGNFDRYYGVETGVFGAASIKQAGFQQCNPNGSPTTNLQPEVDLGTGVINLVITDALANSGEGGYFFVIDLLNQQEVNCIGGTVPKTNAPTMFVMGSDYYPNSPQGYSTYNEPFWNGTDAPRTASHELQHFIHALSKVFQHNVGDDAWVDEGCSMLAEDLAADGMHIDTPRFSYAYLLEPGDFSLTSFTGYQPDPLSTNPNAPYRFYHNTAGNYGMSYLFFRYLYDRFGQNTITNLVQSPQGGVANVTSVTGEPFTQLYQEWATAVAAQSTGITNDPRFSFNPALVLRGTITVTSRRPGGLRPLTFAGPQHPEDSASNPPASFFPILTPGVTDTPKLIDGATLFFKAIPTAGGDTVRASTTSSAAAFQASLVQGKYTQGTPFTPNP